MLRSFLLRNTHTGRSGLLSPGLPELIFASTAHQEAVFFCCENPRLIISRLGLPAALRRPFFCCGPRVARGSSPAVVVVPPLACGFLPLLCLAGRAHHCTAPGARPPLGCFPESSQGSGTPRTLTRGPGLVLTRLPALHPPALRTSHRVLPSNALSSLRTRDSLAKKNHLLQEAS